MKVSKLLKKMKSIKLRWHRNYITVQPKNTKSIDSNSKDSIMLAQMHGGK